MCVLFLCQTEKLCVFKSANADTSLFSLPLCIMREVSLSDLQVDVYGLCERKANPCIFTGCGPGRVIALKAVTRNCRKTALGSKFSNHGIRVKFSGASRKKK